jgi:hypothetical protein
MNRKLSMALVVGLLVLSMDRGHAQGALPEPLVRAQPTGLKGGIVLAGNSARGVTVSRNGAVLASFTFPTGTFLSVTYDDRMPSSITDGRWTFQGDFVLRALPASEPGSPGVRRMEQVVNQAPLEMTLRGGAVAIENLR